MGKCSALQSQWWLWQQLGARCGGRKSRLCLLGLSPHPVSLCSWGPDDDGKTVDGPHQLGKVNPSSSSPGGASRACGLLLPVQGGRDVAVTLCTSVCVPRCQQRCPCHHGVGRGQAAAGGQRAGGAGQGRLSFPRRGCSQQGKAVSQPVEGVALAACAAHGCSLLRSWSFPCAQGGSPGRDGAFEYWQEIRGRKSQS